MLVVEPMYLGSIPVINAEIWFVVTVILMGYVINADKEGG